MLVTLEGQIDKITFFNNENGYTIARVKVQGEGDTVTIVGNLLSPGPGEILEMEGEWTHHPKYGKQFKVSSYKTKDPATKAGIEKYLCSGLIKGIGPVMAKRIVKSFGKDTLQIIEQDINKLSQIEGIGTKRITMIKKAWDEQKEIREVMLFLQSHGISPGYATKIFKHYGNQAITIVKKNPYKLAMDIFGIGFITADNIAQQLGYDKSSELRVEAGIIYVLNQLSGEGHVYYPYEPLLQKCNEILGVEREVIVRAFGTISLEKKIVIEDLNDNVDEFQENHKAVYLSKYHLCETRTAQKLLALHSGQKSHNDLTIKNTIEWVADNLLIQLADKQKEALEAVLSHNVVVITGGPGTGKTTIINALCKISLSLNEIIMLAAPTGRAAKRMNEATGHEAKTIHRLLEYNYKMGGFVRNEENPLLCDVLIIDEASMIDTILMYNLLKAVPQTATLILVGDIHQLPAIGAGNVLHDIIDSGVIPVVTLDEIYRQAKESQIIINAYKINSGIIPEFPQEQKDTDFYFIEQENPEKILEMIIALVQKRIPDKFGLDSINDIQVLTPMHKGVVGTENLNSELQKILNPVEDKIIRGANTFRLYDKVMQIRNNYEKEVYNGDIGRITTIDRENQEVIISFDGENKTYDYGDLDEIVLSYAISVHKSQGSEYPAVIIPMVTQHYMLLQRNLIYTAVTRGKNLVVVIGSKKAMAMGIKNNKTKKRYTSLQYRLRIKL